MTLHDVQRLGDHWRRSPPITVLLRVALAAMGVKLPELLAEKPKRQYMTSEQFERLVRQTDGLNMGNG